jgi:hypothetical protein
VPLRLLVAVSRTGGRPTVSYDATPRPRSVKPFQATKQTPAGPLLCRVGAMAVMSMRAHAACTSGRVARTACARRQTLHARCVPAGARRAGAPCSATGATATRAHAS